MRINFRDSNCYVLPDDLLRFLTSRLACAKLSVKEYDGMQVRNIRTALLFVLVFALGAYPLAANADKALQITDGVKVTMEYTLTLPDKTVADTTVGKEPFSYVQGEHQILPGLEKALTGLKAGDKKRVALTAAEAYGPYDDKRKVSVPKANVPPEAKVGMFLHSEDGHEAKVLEVNPDTVLLDVNHPLAGKNLVFDVNIVKVEKAPREK